MKDFEAHILVVDDDKAIRELVKESLDSIRDIIINNMYAGYISKYIKLDIELRKYQALATFIGQYPRYIIEALMISIMTSAAYFLKNQDGETDILPTLAIFSLGFLRLLPPMQTIYLNLSNIKSFSQSILIAVSDGTSIPIEISPIKLFLFFIQFLLVM